MKLITNALGTFVIDKKKVIDKRLFKTPEDFSNKKIISQYETQLAKKYPKAKKTNDYVFPHARELLPRFQKAAMYNASKACIAAVQREHLVMQAVQAMRDLEKAANPLAKRLREWFALNCPEAAENIEDHEDFVAIILSKNKQSILKDLKIKASIGKDLSKIDLAPIEQFAKTIKALYEERQKIHAYIETTMQDLAPNTAAVAGPILGAQLIAHAGSLRRLALLPASTIQMLGAERALFRFLQKRGRCPKHGILITHPLVARSKEKGKAARKLAAALSIAAKVDYFEGDQYTGYKLREKLEK